MKTLTWWFIGILIFVGLTVSIYFGIQPQPLGIIDYSTFQSVDTFNDALTKRMHFEIKDSPILFIGIQPDNEFEYQLWANFLATTEKTPDLKYDYVVAAAGLQFANLLPQHQDLRQDTTKEEFLDGLKKIMADHKRVAFFFPYNEVTKYNRAGVVSQLGTEFTYPGFAFITSPFARKRDEETSLPVKCGNENDKADASQLGCLIQNSGRAAYRKKNPDNKLEAIVSQIGQQEYLVLVNPPH